MKRFVLICCHIHILWSLSRTLIGAVLKEPRALDYFNGDQAIAENLVNSVNAETKDIHKHSPLSNEEVVRLRKSERHRFGEAHYVDYPGLLISNDDDYDNEEAQPDGENDASEESASSKDIKNKVKTLIKTKNALRRVDSVFEFLGAVAESGRGIGLFVETGSESAAENG